MALQVELVSPEEVLFSGDAHMVIVRVIEGGEIAFMPGHAPFLGALDTGYEAKIQLEEGGPLQIIKLNGGFVEVSHDKVTILSDEAELVE